MDGGSGSFDGPSTGGGGAGFGLDALAAASAYPTMISVPAGSPPCAAVRTTWSPVTKPRYPWRAPCLRTTAFSSVIA